MQSQCIGYHKAQARTLSLLALVSLLIEDGVGKDEFKQVSLARLTSRVAHSCGLQCESRLGPPI